MLSTGTVLEVPQVTWTGKASLAGAEQVVAVAVTPASDCNRGHLGHGHGLPGCQ